MDLSVRGSRPPSARTRRTTNPITGLEMTHTAREERASAYRRARQRPEGVPSLDIVDKDEDKMDMAYDAYLYKLDSPGSESTVSWGTPKTTYNDIKVRDTARTERRTSRPEGVPNLQIESSRKGSARPPDKPRKKTAWDEPAVPENLPAPSERYTKQYEQYKQDMKDSYRQKCSQDVPQADIEAKVNELKIDLSERRRVLNSNDVDEYKHELQKAWTNQPYSKAQQRKRQDLEHLEDEKRKNKLIETVMIDQLSRSVMSDPEQNRILSGRRSTFHQPGMKRGTFRSLHESSVSAGATENVLSKYVRFGARLLTRVGRDAIRELTGFYFATDDSVTIYEYRIFGKTAKAMPFINRGCYRHLRGRRRGEIYKLNDIYPGATLEINPQNQPLPESLLKLDCVEFRITDVDEEASRDILLAGVPGHARESTWQCIHLPPNTQELQDYRLMKDIQGLVQRQLRKRGIKVWTSLGRLFRQLDESGDGKLNKYELEKAMVDYHIDIPQEKFDDLWDVLDEESTSFMDYCHFLRGFIGDMQEHRKAYVRKAFIKLDAGRRGVIHIEDMRKFYNSYKHPKVISGECTEREVRETFLESFANCREGNVTYTEFEEYYEGLSACIEDDEDFIKILQNAWGV